MIMRLWCYLRGYHYCDHPELLDGGDSIKFKTSSSLVWRKYSDEVLLVKKCKCGWVEYSDPVPKVVGQKIDYCPKFYSVGM